MVEYLPDDERPPGEPRRFPWRVVGYFAAGIVAVAGLTIVAFVIAVAVSLNAWSSNK